jgi:NTP pyrophosphatase (non-canonical NTP hydrolase)
MHIRDFQEFIEKEYGKKDRGRGEDKTFIWFMEEVGELARAWHRDQDRENLEEEFADCFAWLTSLASIKGVDIEKAIGKKYSSAL